MPLVNYWGLSQAWNYYPIKQSLVMDDLKQNYQRQLESVGVPPNLATQVAAIIAKDDPAKDDLGRTSEELHIVQSAYTWMLAKQKQQ